MRLSGSFRGKALAGGAALAVMLAAATGFRYVGVAHTAHSMYQPAVAQEAPSRPAAWLGMGIADLNEQLAKHLGVSETSGVIVTAVAPDSPAAKGDVQRKDIILKVNGADVSNAKGVREALATVKPEDTVELTVNRGGEEKSLSVIAAAPPPPPPGRPGMPPGGPGMVPGGPAGMLAPFLKELKDIPPGEQFSHMLGASMTIKDKDGKPVTIDVNFGKVASVTATSVTVNPNDGTATVTYNAGDNTLVRGRGFRLTQLQAGDQVVVVSAAGEPAARAVIMVPGPRPQPGPRPEPRHGQGPGQGPRQGPGPDGQRPQGFMPWDGMGTDQQGFGAFDQRFHFNSPPSGAFGWGEGSRWSGHTGPDADEADSHPGDRS